MSKIQTVIVIDDNEDDLFLAMKELKQYNPDIVTYGFPKVEDGMEFLKKSSVRGIQMVFIDLYLNNEEGGVRRGTDFIKDIQSFAYEVPVVVLTGSENPKDVLEAYKHNICKYVIKPLTEKMIIQLERHVHEYRS